MRSLISKIVTQTSLSHQQATWLLEHITQKTQAYLLTQNTPLSAQQQEQLDLAIKQLQNHMPLAYIIGFVPFLELTIQVQPPILIARPETEQWVAKLINDLRPYQDQIKTILDIGTGSGCIALALAHHFPQAQITAIDINPQALTLAKHNAQKLNIHNITFLKSDLFQALEPEQKFDLIVSNPPYIDPAMKSSISYQVKNWEDNKALFASNQGLEIIEKILKNAQPFLNVRLLPYQLVIEIDQYHHQQVIDFARQNNWNFELQKDLFQNWRTIWCSKK